VIQLEPRRAPPQDYYRDNFQTLLQFCADHYAPALRAEDHLYIKDWSQLSTQAQRLLVRIFTRKGPWLRADKLVYAEVGATEPALNALADAGLVECGGEIPADQLLSLLTLVELAGLFPSVERKFRPRRKSEWYTCLLSLHTDRVLRERIARHHRWLRLSRVDCLERLHLLCFGDLVQDLSAFVLRDLGLVRYEKYQLDHELSELRQPQIVQRFLDISHSEAWLHRLAETHGLDRALYDRLAQPGPHRASERRRSRILNELGRFHERHADMDAALACYRASTRHPARERQVRLLCKAGCESGASVVLQKMAQAPWCVEEEI
jgi:hypothetical protein